MDMTLQEALNKAVKEFGKDVLIEPRLLNILNDYHGFNEMRSARHIISILQKDNHMIDLIKDETNSVFKINRLAQKLNNKYGVDKAITAEVERCILTAIKPSLSTDYSQKDEASAWLDPFGVLYSEDGQKLLRIKTSSLFYYFVNFGTKIVCNNAFRFCFSLKSIIFPESLTHIGKGSFLGCGSLQLITFPKSLAHIGEYAFFGCVSLQSLTIPEEVEYIDSKAFSFCKLLQFLSLPKIEYISPDAFSECDSLVRVSIPIGSRSHFEKLLPKEMHEKLVEQ